MNEAQKEASRRRQRALVANQLGTEEDDQPAAPPPPPQRPIAELVAEQRPDVGPGVAVKFLRFTDKSFQVAGMQSGETLTAQVLPNGRSHTIELVPKLDAFLVTYVDPAQRKVEFDMVERSAVRTWRYA